MYSWMLLLILAIIAIFLIIYSVRKNKNKHYNDVIIPPPKFFLQSPEYRCSTKCFDCVRQESQMYLQKSHGRPTMHVGM